MRIFAVLMMLTLVGCSGQPATLPPDQLDYSGTWRVTYTLDQKPPIFSQVSLTTLTLSKFATGFSGKEVADILALTCNATLTVKGSTGSYLCSYGPLLPSFQVTLNLDTPNRFTGKYSANFSGATIPGSVVFVRQ